jgi:hypothetical protein
MSIKLKTVCISSSEKFLEREYTNFLKSYKHIWPDFLELNLLKIVYKFKLFNWRIFNSFVKQAVIWAYNYGLISIKVS